MFGKSKSVSSTENISETTAVSEQVTSGAESEATSVAARDSEVVIDQSITTESVDAEVTELITGASVDMNELYVDALERSNKINQETIQDVLDANEKVTLESMASQEAALNESLASIAESNRQAYNLVSASTSRALGVGEEFGEKTFRLASETNELVSDSMDTLENLTSETQQFSSDLIDTLDDNYQRSLDAQKEFTTEFTETFSRAQSSETTQLASEAIDVQKQLIVGVIIIGVGFVLFRGMRI